VRARTRPSERRHRSAAGAVHGGRVVGRRPFGSRRAVPRRRTGGVRVARLSRRHAHREKHGDLEASLRQPPELRHRDVADRGPESTRRDRRELPAYESRRKEGGGMSVLTGVLERVPAAYYTDERQAILESAREFAMKEVLPIANELDPVQG